MKGTILDFTVTNNEGYISGDDGQRYVFSGTEWKSQGAPARGQKVDFTTQGDRALAVFLLVSVTGQKNKYVAALLAWFLGVFGAHKFYLGNTSAGVIMLCCSLFGWVLLFIPTGIIALISIIECVIYLVKSDEDFDQTYVQNKKPWF